jgi:peptidyl-prolyl cis-trans isomerase A (cyclophilin A)
MIQAGAYDDELTPHAPTRGPIVNEFDRSNLRGTVAMAKSEDDPDSATSQFFINLANNSGPPPALDTQNGGFTVFGEVVSGMDVVDTIAGVDTHYVNPGLRYVPDEPVIIESATVIPEPATIVLLGLGCLAFVRKHRR